MIGAVGYGVVCDTGRSTYSNIRNTCCTPYEILCSLLYMRSLVFTREYSELRVQGSEYSSTVRVPSQVVCSKARCTPVVRR